MREKDAPKKHKRLYNTYKKKYSHGHQLYLHGGAHGRLPAVLPRPQQGEAQRQQGRGDHRDGNSRWRQGQGEAEHGGRG